MPLPSILVLFDIDSTLLQVQRGLSMENFVDAFGRALDLDDVHVDDGYTFHGRTDRSIYRDVCRQNGVEPDRRQEREHVFIENLVHGWKRLLSPDTVSLLDGARESVLRGDADDRVFLSILTGNVEDGARVKLSTHGLTPYFRSGGFGSDAVERNDLPDIALRRIAEETGHSFSAEQTVIVGDSIRDIECARAAGMHAVAVATGGDSPEKLRSHEPDLLLDSLSDPDRLFSFIYERTA